MVRGAPTFSAPGSCYSGICSGPVCLLACSGTDGINPFACELICFYGDPHERTADGLEIDFQAAGEFVVARSADGSVELQARFEVPAATSP